MRRECMRLPRRRDRFGLAALIVISVANLMGAGAATVYGASADAAPDGDGRFAAPSWRQFVVAPNSRNVRPIRVLSTSGDVTNPDGLLGRGVAVFKRPPLPPRP